MVEPGGCPHRRADRGALPGPGHAAPPRDASGDPADELRRQVNFRLGPDEHARLLEAARRSACAPACSRGADGPRRRPALPTHGATHERRHARPAGRVRGHPARLRAGRLRRPRAARRGEGPRRRASASLAMQLAYGTVQRRLTLDHFVEQLARPVERARPADARGAAARALPARLPRRRRRARRRRRERRAGQGRARRRAQARQRGAAARGARRAARAAGRRHARRRGDRALLSAVARRAVVGALRARRDARAAARGQRARRARAARQHAARHARRRSPRRSPASRRTRAGGRRAARGPRRRGRLRRPRPPALRAQGAYTAQSRAAMLVARALDPQPGERVLDLCAAPGGKTTHLAALMGDSGRDRRRRAPRRPRAGAAAHVRADGRDVGRASCTADAARFTADAPFDRALVDPPCSGLGTLQGHPDLRWRMTPEAIERLARGQAAILAAARAARCARAARSSTRRARCRRPRTRRSWPRSGCH